MNFLLSPEQIQLQEELQRLLAERCDSRALHAAFDSDSGFDTGLWRALVDFGVAGITIGEAHGGLGLEMIDLALVAEMIGRAAAPVPFLGHVLAATAIALGGDDTLKARWLPALASGEALGCAAFQEEGERWEPGDWRLNAGGGRIEGTKLYVPNAMEADIAVVGLAEGKLGLVDLRGAGVAIERMGGIDRTRRIDAVRFSGAPVTPLADGIAAKLRDAGLILLAADAFGGASRCVEMATAYTQQREQFGVPISDFQAVRHQLANMALATEPCRGLHWFAAHAYDHLPDKAEHGAALAKAHICETFLQVARDAIELHGGIGYTWEADPQIWLKRAMFDFAWAGAPAHHRARAADLAGW